MTHPQIPHLTVNGVRIPATGYGVSKVMGDHAGEAALAAIHAGYRLLDTAPTYGTEPGTGEAIRASGVPRAELTVITKVPPSHLRADDLKRSVDESLRRLGLDHVDLLLLHWPNPDVPLAETMPALAQVKQRGLARQIGVSNFPIALIEEAMRLCPEPLFAIEAENYPYLDQTKLTAACRERGLLFIAFCPVGRGTLAHDPVLGQIARSHDKTIAQVALRWLIQQGNIVPIPNTSRPERMAENLAVFDFTLSGDEMARIAALKRPGSRLSRNSHGPDPDWD